MSRSSLVQARSKGSFGSLHELLRRKTTFVSFKNRKCRCLWLDMSRLEAYPLVLLRTSHEKQFAWQVYEGTKLLTTTRE
ncbi:hypothetical protein PsorP6_015053 [Peronosclerospora sorghi]|uniref:Uncharacterized protein n=1 Tax=Peronosclerospora sorghi TaxID=230839 RepID=A0ACC0VUD5_9STRA|nr:hypothetical protein PsorP6_015053 [Peronosclerospora sorghi]